MRKTRWMAGLVGAALMFLLSSPASAEDLYRRAAEGFLAFLDSRQAILSVEILRENSLNPDPAEIESGALVRLESGGYLLISSNRSLTPIKAYSLTRPFEDLPGPVRRYFLQEMEGNARAVLQSARIAQYQALTVPENHARWDFLLTFKLSRQALAYAPDTWLLATTWNQKYPYNRFTPRIEGVPTPTGCVNTAIAQIMKYYGHPARGRGIASYEWNGRTLKAVLFKDYNWEHMPETLDASTPPWQADQVASLMSDIGIANNTLYGIDGSSVALQPENIIRHFGYSTELRRLSNTDSEEFFDSLTTEIDAKRPVLLSVPGHMVVADGYRDDPTGRSIHLNMGWGGNHDDFYYLETTIEAGGYQFPTDPGDLAIYFPVKPCEGPDCDWASETVPGAPPEIITILSDRILGSELPAAARIYLDVRTESGDAVSVRVSSSNRTALQAVVEDSILTLSTGPANRASEVIVEAEASGVKTLESFVVVTTDSETGFGKTFHVTGRFSDQTEIYEHAVILDGLCSISGDRGYANQAFYSAVLDAEGAAVVDWDDEALEASFQQGMYRLAATLDNPATNYFYPYEEGVHEGYLLSVSCPELDESIETIARLLGVDLKDALAYDGRFNLGHVVVLLRYAAGLIHLTNLQKAALNLAGHAEPDHVGLADAVIILRAMTGVE